MKYKAAPLGFTARGCFEVRRRKDSIRTDAGNDTVAETLEVAHPVVGRLEHVVKHLHGFGLLDLVVVVLAHLLRQVLVDQLSHQAPCWGVVHPQQVVSFGDDALADFIGRTFAGDGAPLVQKLLDDATVREHHCCRGTELESEHASILLGPFREPIARSVWANGAHMDFKAVKTYWR